MDGIIYAATVAVAISDHGPFSPRVLIHPAMKMAVFPPSPSLNSARKVGLVVMVRKASAAHPASPQLS